MAHVGASRILTRCPAQGYGIPCLLAGNLEMMIGAIRAAEAVGAPLILAYNAQVTPQIPMALIVPAMVRAAERASVPIATILDHGPDLEAAVQAIQLGISTVMYDGSRLSFDENVRTTQEVVRVAHAAGVDVEGELGAIGGSSVELGYADAASEFTDPALAVEFVKQHRRGHPGDLVRQRARRLRWRTAARSGARAHHCRRRRVAAGHARRLGVGRGKLRCGDRRRHQQGQLLCRHGHCGHPHPARVPGGCAGQRV